MWQCVDVYTDTQYCRVGVCDVRVAVVGIDSTDWIGKTQTVIYKSDFEQVCFNFVGFVLNLGNK